MSEWSGVSTVAMLIPLVAVLGGFAVAIVAVISRSRLRELEIRERIAMIEKGLVPPPEVDPGGFEHAMSLLETAHRVWPGVLSRGAGRHRRAGITLLGVGLGLMLLIGVAGGVPDAGIGVGGFVATIGAAFLVISFLEPQSTLPPAAGTDKPPRP